MAGGTSPLSAIEGAPVAAESGDWGDAVAIFNDDENYYDYSGKYWEDEGANGEYGYTYNNNSPNAIDPRADNNAPAPITYMPTSTTDPARPRTVAAGWDRKRRVLTVVFRDGTFYNYYEVDAGTWNNFKTAYSKGHFIIAFLDDKPRGIADVTSMNNNMREALYRLSRTGQILQKGITGRQSASGRDRYMSKWAAAGRKEDRAVAGGAVRNPNLKRGKQGIPLIYQPGNLGGTGRKRTKG